MTEVQEEGVHPKTCTNLKRLMFHVDNILPWLFIINLRSLRVDRASTAINIYRAEEM